MFKNYLEEQKQDQSKNYSNRNSKRSVAAPLTLAGNNISVGPPPRAQRGPNPLVPASRQQKPLYDPTHRLTAGDQASRMRMNSANRASGAQRQHLNSGGRSLAAHEFAMGVGGTAIR